MKVLFYLIEDRLSPRGGPLGVGYYYYQEMKKRDSNLIDFLKSDVAYETVHSAGRSITKHFPDWLNRVHRNYRGAKNLKKLLEIEPAKTSVPLDDYDIVFFHETKDLYKEKENLKSYRGIVILQSHSPLPLWQEQTTDLPDIYFKMIPDLKEKFSKIIVVQLSRQKHLAFLMNPLLVDKWRGEEGAPSSPLIYQAALAASRSIAGRYRDAGVS